MRILIVGEYSGFAQNLKKGFIATNNECVVMSWGDGFKKIPLKDENDILINIKKLFFFGKYIRGSARIGSFISSFSLRKRIKTLSASKNKFDVILVLNPDFIKEKKEFWRAAPSISDLKLLKKNTGKVILSLCGNDAVFNSEIQKYKKASEETIKLCSKINKKKITFFIKFIKVVDYVIPTMYSYANAYRNSPLANGLHILKTIPLPLNINSINSYNKIDEKIIIFHGINRPEKGTAIILKAMENIKKKYPTTVDIIAQGGLPQPEYLELIKRANIVIDQCHSSCYGMNAIYSMAQGKVVFSGNEPECGIEFGRNDIPIVNIQPDATDIEQKLETFINNPILIDQVGKKSRKFVEDFHECSIVAKEYLFSLENISAD